MDFNYVFKALREVFPKVDDRILRAAALEHPKNATAAVELVLSEAVPFTRELSRSSSSAESQCSEEALHFKGDLSYSSSSPGSQSSEAEPGKTDRIKLIEDLIKNAKNNKTILLSRKESVINLVKKVEAQEKCAEHAREEASRGGAAMFTMAEDLKLEAQKTKETNDTMAGDISGEKAILATELMELQDRALSLSYERDKLLAVLDEMLKSLEARLSAAIKEEEDAKNEKIAKEKAAHEAVSEQTLVAEKMRMETARLEGEAEENSKLREFLLDRGHVVDLLQGEILGIFDDVKMLKEKVDGGVSLRKVLSSQISIVCEEESVSSEEEESVSFEEKESVSSKAGSSQPNSAKDGEWELCQ